MRIAARHFSLGRCVNRFDAPELAEIVNLALARKFNGISCSSSASVWIADVSGEAFDETTCSVFAWSK